MKELFKKPFLILPAVLILGYIVFTISGKFTSFVVKFLPEVFRTDTYLHNMILKLLLMALSILIMMLIPKMKLKEFGLRIPKKINYFKLTWQTAAFTIGGLIVWGLLFMGLLRNLFGDTNEAGFPDSDSFIKTLISVWIWSSICEEVFNRGLLQTLLDVFRKYKFLKLSVSVWISGMIFGAMHFSVFKFSNSVFFVLFIVFNTTTLGVLAAYYREKSESIFPAILVHIIGNIAGSLPLLLQALFKV